MSTINFFNLAFNAVTLDKAVNKIVEAAVIHQRGLVVTPNVDHIVMMEQDHEMLEVFQQALFRFADGMPLVWLSRLLFKNPLPERVTGSDLFPAVCQAAGREKLTVFFLGGNPGVAESAATKLKTRYPDLVVSGVYCPPYGFELDQVETKHIISLINESGAHLLFIGVGTPKQEKWAFANLSSLNTGPILCIGASFDFIAGTVKRAPRFIQKAGFEWLWRLIKEPRRLWRRYILRDSRFILLTFLELINIKKKGLKSL
jgi:N-acetylglucosaminyldiphosphoundecaprenol N-acetyl-beta-D-mannosaminyltransferase